MNYLDRLDCDLRKRSLEDKCWKDKNITVGAKTINLIMTNSKPIYIQKVIEKI